MFLKRIALCTATLCFAAVGSLGAATIANANDIQQISGKDRYETSLLIAKRAYPQQADNVYLTRGDLLVDALSAASLKDGPIVLIRRDSDNAQVAQYVKSLNIKHKVIALGGPAALPKEIIEKIAAGKPTDRLNGYSRYETSASIAMHAFPEEVPVAYLANGEGDGSKSADAVAGGSLKDGPLLLVDTNTSQMDAVNLNKAQRDSLSNMKVKQVVALGGTKAIPEEILNSVASGKQTDRIDGADRYETAAKIASRAFPGHKGNFYVARGDLFADAVSAGALKDGPIVLSPRDVSPAITPAISYAKEHPGTPIFLGGSIWQPEVMMAITNRVMPEKKEEPQTNTGPEQLSLQELAFNEERYIHEGVNYERALKGVAPLTRDTEIDKMAAAWSEKMATKQVLEHSTVDSTMGIMNLLGRKCTKVAENISYYRIVGAPIDGSAGMYHMNNWVNSQGHYNNLMNPEYNRTGIGIHVKLLENGYIESYATQMFCN